MSSNYSDLFVNLQQNVNQVLTTIFQNVIIKKMSYLIAKFLNLLNISIPHNIIAIISMALVLVVANIIIEKIMSFFHSFKHTRSRYSSSCKSVVNKHKKENSSGKRKSHEEDSCKEDSCKEYSCNNSNSCNECSCVSNNSDKCFQSSSKKHSK
jgi:hypothetical protein